MDEADNIGDDDNIFEGGAAFLLKWFKETWSDPAKDVIYQFMVFYILILIGFSLLFLMMKSTNQIREFRKNVADTLKHQKDKKFDLDSYRLMTGGGYI
mmetsp:Transcript_29678/g.54418  ORF Transcript_29678/g.54418 Transcript_29678/m.54418 type:complete len:98 (+) Transcript_29678:298-591(+)|eukprot:CAMPEP_0175066974 /NCGR_PEP_ID=MMETSP0052_2-20121109/16820_1 /TAXON_ID=51329 ORGANISM="Polytomella parva, Strain SAG 63-3" /NCGR_SAMPLE_ID=MMETSP0052_2 /ASSEMBLY_ACC=CAM_ASM_000194 /LENGTH=97 /DNA_ID=CAMNT_0016333763 /DNA_START=148 /DNA_END=441 /DNA_ORIENTATION=+